MCVYVCVMLCKCQRFCEYTRGYVHVYIRLIMFFALTCTSIHFILVHVHISPHAQVYTSMDTHTRIIVSFYNVRNVYALCVWIAFTVHACIHTWHAYAHMQLCSLLQCGDTARDYLTKEADFEIFDRGEWLLEVFFWMCMYVCVDVYMYMYMWMCSSV